MTHQAKALQEYEPHEDDQYTVAELDRELLIRGAQIPEAKKTEIGDVAGTPQQDSKNLQIKEI
ncbi:MAG: hypothetical protein GY757_59850, partial [bacterium]|nr:hypothetical protein [bacterium]